MVSFSRLLCFLSFALLTYHSPRTGLQSFLSIPAHFVLLTDSAPNNANSSFEARRISVGMLLFSRNHLKASTRAECRPSYGVAVGNTCVEMKELFQLNSFLLNNSHLYASAKAIAAEWPLIGVFKNETCVLAFCMSWPFCAH